MQRDETSRNDLRMWAGKKQAENAILSRKRVQRLAVGATKIARTFVILGLAFIILYPILYIVSVSLRMPSDALDPMVVWIPKSLTFENYTMAMEFMKYGATLLRTVVLVLLCTVLQCFTCSITGYGFARFRFKGRGLLFGCVIFTLLVPVQNITMPLFLNYSSFSRATGIPMIDTPLPMALLAFLGNGIRAALFIYLFSQFFRNLPGELEEAAYIDGSGPVSAFFRVIVPNAGSIFLVAFLLTFVWYWNDYYSTVLFYSSSEPLSITLNNLTTVIGSGLRADGLPYSATEIAAYQKAAAILFMLPVLLLYLVLQKRFTRSFLLSGIVG